ncbi:Transposase-associated domain [Sesbania bispinosa]|nr:Transposase-associated domain [Sesbania bispinosa]
MKLKDRSMPEYLKGIDDFLDFAFSGPKPKNTIRCPYCKCNNFYYKTRDNVMHDLLKWGFEPSYKHWEYHGESSGDSLSDDDSNSKGEDVDFGVNLEGNDDAQTYSMLHDMHQSLNVDRGSQAGLVYYVKHSDKENWYTVVKVKPRNIFDLPDEDDSEPYQHNELGGTCGELEAPPVNQDEEILNRADINGLCLDGYVVNQEEESDNTSDVDTDDDQEESHIDESDEYSQNEDSDLE